MPCHSQKANLNKRALSFDQSQTWRKRIFLRPTQSLKTLHMCVFKIEVVKLEALEDAGFSGPKVVRIER